MCKVVFTQDNRRNLGIYLKVRFEINENYEKAWKNL